MLPPIYVAVKLPVKIKNALSGGRALRNRDEMCYTARKAIRAVISPQLTPMVST